MATIKGFDISRYQTNIDLSAAKKAGYEFVILKLGETNKDSCFDKFYTAAKAAGLKIGAYYFAHAKVSGNTSWERCKSWLGSKKLDLPLAFDMEAELSSPSRKAENTSLYLDFAKLANAAGIPTMIYCSESFAKNCIDMTKINDPLWIAKYSSTKPSVPGKTISIWQWSSDKDTKDFYQGKLDRNYLYVSYDELNKKKSTSSTTIASKPTAAAKNIPTLATPILKKGSKGTNVKYLQQDLNYLGYKGSNGKALTVDGNFGGNTQYALRNFQTKNKLVVDGIYGSKSQTKMKTLLK